MKMDFDRFVESYLSPTRLSQQCACKSRGKFTAWAGDGLLGKPGLVNNRSFHQGFASSSSTYRLDRFQGFLP